MTPSFGLPKFGALFLAIGLVGMDGPQSPFRPNEKAFFADQRVLNFVRPGLVIRIGSAEVAADGTISCAFTVTDARGAALDRLGVQTPGTVSLNFIAAAIPRGQLDYVSYTTRQQTGAVSGTVTQASGESNGTFTQVGDGMYRYTFRTRATNVDRNATHTIGIYANRNLSEFDLGTNYFSTTFNFVPDGTPVRTTHDIVRDASCNRCHDSIAAHGGSRRGMDMCVLCHSPQTKDPDTGNSVDMMAMVHKIHMGKELPSVRAGGKYQIIGFGGTVFDWSTVGFPANNRRCETCHDQKSGAAQAANYMTRPTRESCGSCHDNVNFATGQGHIAGPQFSDNQCATCHIPQGEFDFDASIQGAHAVPTESRMLGGLALDITRVDDGVAGRRPTVTFTVKNGKGEPLAISALSSVSLVMAGPTTDYGKTSFGSDVLTPGYVSESAVRATCASDGTCRYTFTRAIPSDARGTFAVGIEGRRSETLLAGTTRQRTVQYGAKNDVFYFSVDGTSVVARRTVVATENCNQCHVRLSLHGENRNQMEMCVLCHNPLETDVRRRPLAQVQAERTKPPHSVNFNLMVHRIHMGEHLRANGRDATIIGFGGSVNNFTEVRYPAMSPSSTPGDLRNCANCHVGGSEQVLTRMVHDVVDPQGPLNPVKPVTSACTGCHVTPSTASHALANTTSLGESCNTCHSSTSAFSVAKSHAQ